MAAGDVTFGSAGNNVKKTLCLAFESTGETAPSAADDGFAAYESSADMWAQDARGAFYVAEAPEDHLVTVTSTAGSGTMTADVSIWGYLADTDEWYEAAHLNGGSAIAETSADAIAYAEVVSGLKFYDRLAAEVTVAGTGTAVSVHITTCTKAGR